MYEQYGLKIEDETDSLFYKKQNRNIVIESLKLTRDFCSHQLKTKNTIKNQQILFSFKNYCDKMRPLIQLLMKEATDIQVRGIVNLLLKWKKKMGDELWKKMYAIIPAVWVASRNSVREQCLRLVMDKKAQNTHIIIGENLNTLEDSRLLVGRIVHDRIMSRMIFGTHTKWDKQKCQGLGSRTDSLGYDARNAIEHLYHRHALSNEKCPQKTNSKL